MKSHSYRLFCYGEKFKLVFSKCTDQSEKRQSRRDMLSTRYEDWWDYITDEIDYELAYSAFLSKQNSKQLFADSVVSELESKKRFSQSISRTKSRVYELAMCNNFQYFCTFTLSKDKRDRFDLKNFSRDFGQFIRNLNRNRSGDRKLKYLIIPEKHRDGAWHAHGLMSGIAPDDLVVNDNGYLDWIEYKKRFGFVSFSVIQDTNACASYITKYITKDVANSNREACGHLYFASQGLNKRLFVFGGVADSNTFSKDFDFENDFVKISWFDTFEDVENFFNTR